MKTKLVLFFSICFSIMLVAQDDLKSTSSGNYFEYCKNMDAYFNNEMVNKREVKENDFDDEYKAYQRWKWYWRTRVDDSGNFPELASAVKEANKVAVFSASSSWTNISSTFCEGGYDGMGRTTCIAFHPIDSNTFYVGAPIGGLWKTTDGGLTYNPLTDSLPYVSVGNCVIDPTNPNVIYISIGDNFIYGQNSMGVFKSIDGGLTWNTTGLSWTLAQGKAITDLAMDPNNSSVLYAAASDGLYKTANGGATWTVVHASRHLQIRFEPGSSNIYSSTYDPWSLTEVFRSTDAGASWTQITNFNSSNNQIRMAVTPADPARIAILNTSNNQLYVSTNYGGGLTMVGTCPENKILLYSATNPDHIYCGALDVYQSINGGNSWTQLTSWYGNPAYTEVHADQRNAFYSPLQLDKLFFCNDGGVYIYSESGNTWTERSNGLIITQFYSVDNSQQNSQIILAGSQDNSGRMRISTGIWKDTNSGDAMEVKVDPTNDSVIYTCSHNGLLYRSLDGWTNNQTMISQNIPGGTPSGGWVTPYELDPSDPNTIVAGYDEVWRSTDRGNTWAQISTNLTQGYDLNCIAVAPSDPNTIYASHYYTLYVTNNLGASWTTLNNLPEEITSIVVHPLYPNIVWVTFGRYNSNKKVYVSSNSGSSWTNLSSGLPNVPINCMIRVNGSTDCQLFIGTDAGVFYRDSISNTWFKYGYDLPNTSVTDFSIFYPEMKLRASTFGRGLWEIDIASEVSNTQLSTPKSPSLIVYPNPSNSQITINYKSSLIENAKVSIINSLGQTVLSEIIEFKQLQESSIDISKFPLGSYILLIQQGNQLVHRVFLKD